MTRHYNSEGIFMLSLKFIKKEKSTEVFSFEFREICKNTFFTDDLPRKVPASARPLPESSRNLFGRFHEF